MSARLAASAASALAMLAAPAAAHAATLTAAPLKPCYRAGEQVALGGSGYTPNGSVQINSDGRVAGSATADPAGSFGGALQVGVPSGERLKTYSAVDTGNPAITASLQLRVSRLMVTVRPQTGRPDRPRRIGARGFTTGTTLYAHIVRGSRYRRTVRIGRLKGACHKLSARKRVFSRRTSSGVYTVQFDTRRRYSSKTAVRYRFSVPVFRTAASHVAAAQSWTRG
jgi:hypothetical protein